VCEKDIYYIKYVMHEVRVKLWFTLEN